MAIYVWLNENGIIDNVIEWDGESAISIPDGESLLPCSEPAGIGWVWVDGKPVNPNPPPVIETIKPEPVVPGGPGIVA